MRNSLLGFLILGCLSFSFRSMASSETIRDALESPQSFPYSAAPYRDHEDNLLDSNYDFSGKGLFLHHPRIVRDTGPFISVKAIWHNAIPMTSGLIDFNSIYDEVFLPVVQKDFPELIEAYEHSSKELTEKEKAYKYLYQKIIDESGKNWFFVKLTASMHNSEVPDLANLYFGLSHPIYDVLFDNALISDFNSDERISRLRSIITRDYNISKPSSMENLLISIVQGLENSVPIQNRSVFFHYLLKLHEAQTDSIRQHNSDISPEELRRTTFRKGGYSMVLYALLADHNFKQSEIDAFFLVGAMLQNLDDFSDIAEDKKEGIVTLAMKRLITPSEVWAMKDVVYRRLLELVPAAGYDESAVDTYVGALDKFIDMNSNLYEKAMAE
ncbi:MAG: hypothetical protein SGJ18_07185 [Pseudomonadota bacterium]|nr:hypothetical protein [Pseudomonadota bacterium]